MNRAMRPFACLAAAALALAALAGGPAKADTCAEARAHQGYVGAELTDPRVLQALADISRASNLAPVAACELNMPFFNATAENLGGHYYIALTARVLAQSTDAELRAVIGHEMAHIALGQRAAGFELMHHRTIKYEEEADALSARWFGKEGMVSVLTKLKADALRLPTPAQRRMAAAEIDARIKALQ